MSDRFKQHGAFSWCELQTTDLAAAQQFYGKLFGWKLEDAGLGNMPYTVIKAGEEDIGGMMAAPPDQAAAMPPQWGTYVTADDVDATAQQAEELGAKIIVPPMDIPTVGRFCVLQDPQGATLSVITYQATS